MKYCTACNVKKLLSDFANKSSSKSGKSSQCKPCIAAKVAIYRANNKEKVAACKKKHYETKIATNLGGAMGPAPLTHKICPACKIDKPRSGYYTSKGTINNICKPCSLAYSKSNSHKYLGKYIETTNDWRRNKVATDKDWVESRREVKKAHYDANKDSINAHRRDIWANDPYCSARAANQRRDVRTHTPSWSDKEAIKKIYAECPKGMHVDHIIPILGVIDGRKVSGLHIPINLQYLTASANQKKYNRITEEEIAAL